MDNVVFAAVLSAEYRAEAELPGGLKATATVKVSGGQVQHIQSGTLMRTSDGVAVAAFGSNLPGSKEISYYSGTDVEDTAVLAAVNAFIEGVASAAAGAQEGGEA